MQTEPGHAPNRVYQDTDGHVHLNGGTVWADEFTGRVLDVNKVLPTGAGTLALTVAAHEGRTVLADQAAGVAYTLPSAVAAIVGSRFRILIGTLLTSGNLSVAVANSNDYMVGEVVAGTDDATPYARCWQSANTGTLGTESDTLTLNRTTTGTAARGQWLEFECVAANVWAVRGMIQQNGAEATPFSAAV